jgi:hypothetical protein
MEHRETDAETCRRRQESRNMTMLIKIRNSALSLFARKWINYTTLTKNTGTLASSYQGRFVIYDWLNPDNPKQSILTQESFLFEGFKIMGADLYIKNLRNRLLMEYSRRKRLNSGAQQEIPQSIPGSNKPLPPEAYFRDPYNLYSVLWTLGLSWWEDVLPLLDANSELKGRALKDFRDQVARAEQRLPTKEDLRKHGLRVEDTGERNIEDFQRYLVEQRKALLQFLDLAIASDSAIICSL